jgi:hypothetical protein
MALTCRASIHNTLNERLLLLQLLCRLQELPLQLPHLHWHKLDKQISHERAEWTTPQTRHPGTYRVAQLGALRLQGHHSLHEACLIVLCDHRLQSWQPRLNHGVLRDRAGRKLAFDASSQNITRAHNLTLPEDTEPASAADATESIEGAFESTARLEEAVLAVLR